MTPFPATESTESRLRRFNAELDRLMTASRDQDGHLPDLMEAATRSMTGMLGIRRASVWLLDETQKELICQCLFDAETGQIDSGMTLSAGDFPSYFQAFQTARVVSADDAIEDPRTREFADTYLRVLDIRSMLDAQIRDFRGLRGVVCCEEVGQLRPWREEERAFVASVAEYVGLAMELAGRRALAETLQDTNARLTQALQDAEAANIAKTHFLANASHELRTPLNGILGGAAILKLAPELSGDSRNWVEVIERSGRGLLQVVNSILDMSALEGGNFVLSPQIFNLNDAVAEACELATPSGETAPALMAGPSIDVLADRRRVVQVVSSFIDNAFKFAGHAPDVRIVEGLSAGQVRVEVCDHGPGLSDDQVDHVFGQFSQGDESSRRRHGGIGLGLALSRAIADAMQARIGYQPAEGGGAVFWLEIAEAGE
ncbi:GAF domain-containing sensor histidine kinase [Maricaulis parjimensis]|uniref:GAF domain-containing sensor histidine kinase n=1 Tax=Maricaulis parjimensis TaxID=144023 RepID=UPI001939E12A|nr:GAF domain-containing protein [Maricaulis parjimensis]